MFFDPEKKLTIHNHDLPHWQQAGVYVFITWCLADSVPQTLIKDWKLKRERWLQKHPQPWDDETEKEYHVHILVRLLDTPLEDLMQTWKSVTSHRINKHLKRNGPLCRPNTGTASSETKNTSTKPAATSKETPPKQISPKEITSSGCKGAGAVAPRHFASNPTSKEISRRKKNLKPTHP